MQTKQLLLRKPIVFAIVNGKSADNMNLEIMKNQQRHFFLTISTIIIALTSAGISAAPVVPGGQNFTCTPTHVWDGDGPIWYQEGPRVRLAGIAAREMDGSCRSNHPCPQASAKDARDALVDLVGTPTGVGRHGHILVTGPAMQCSSNGGAGGNRTAAWCVSPQSADVNCAMVRGGWALQWDRYWRGHSCR